MQMTKPPAAGPRTLLKIPTVFQSWETLQRCRAAVVAAIDAQRAHTAADPRDRASPIETAARALVAGEAAAAETPAPIIILQDLEHNRKIAERAVVLAESEYRQLCIQNSPVICDAHRREDDEDSRQVVEGLRLARNALKSRVARRDLLFGEGVVVDFREPVGREHRELLRRLLAANIDNI